jgi:hypothetical protein
MPNVSMIRVTEGAASCAAGGVPEAGVGSVEWLCCLLFIMRPHPDHFDSPLILEDLVDETVLNVDSARICADQITNKFFKGRRIPKRISFQNLEQLLDLGTKIGRRDFLGVLLRLFRKKELPRHQFSDFEDLLSGSFNPLRIESRMPGMETR